MKGGSGAKTRSVIDGSSDCGFLYILSLDTDDFGLSSNPSTSANSSFSVRAVSSYTGFENAVVFILEEGEAAECCCN